MRHKAANEKRAIEEVSVVLIGENSFRSSLAPEVSPKVEFTAENRFSRGHRIPAVYFGSKTFYKFITLH